MSKAQPLPPPTSTEAPAAHVENSLKRPREDDAPSIKQEAEASTSSTLAEAPAAKRARSEWSDVPPPEGNVKGEVDVSNIKTEEQAAAFLEQMTEMLQMASGSEASISTELTDAISQIVKSVGSYDPADIVASSSSVDFASGSKSPKPDDFIKYFDFSSFDPVDDDKVDTPDLVPASSTNPSPESNAAEPDGHSLGSSLSSSDSKNSDLRTSLDVSFDPLRMGPLGEIDGGEAAYYSTMLDWKWDGPMQSQDNPWAILQT